ncbi:MAG: glycogen/starch synthase [Thermoprotei archaeon]|nr:glycogen/starch synthase [Thermoprotei archaeon]
MKLFAPVSIDKVWLISFEYSGLASLGGLGEAVRGRAEALAAAGKSVTVLMPSHGRHLDPLLRFKLGLRDLGFSDCGYRRGVDGRFYGYCLGADEVILNGVRIVAFKGLDSATREVFDVWDIYRNMEEKASLLARAVRAYVQRVQEPPDIVDVNDWHSVLAGVAVRQEAERRGFALPLVYTIHLSGSPSFPWHYASQDWSGLSNGPHLVWRFSSHEIEDYSRVWDSVGGNVEAFGVNEADTIVAVSLSYLREELLPKYGGWIWGKSCVAYNPVDVNVESVEAFIRSRFEGQVEGVEWRAVRDLSGGLKTWGHLEPEGVLMTAIGRLTWQKGFDIAVKALDYAPSVKLLILGIPVGDLGYEDLIRRLVEERPGRVSVVAGKLSSNSKLALIKLSKALVVPSRWEPFGLAAAEATALGVPVIASSVGGLKEIIVDLRASAEGTGLLVKPEDPWELGIAMESIATIEGDPSKAPIKDLKVLGPGSRDRIKANCLRRAREMFSKPAVYSQLEACYEKARLMAYYRAIT